MIKLKSTNGYTAMVNPSNICYMFSFRGSRGIITEIHFAGKTVITVEQTIAQIESLIHKTTVQGKELNQ